MLLPLNHFLQDLSDVLDLYVLLVVEDKSAVFECGNAVRTGGDDLLCAELDRLLHPEVGKTFMLLRLHPDPAAAHAAAEAVNARLGQFDEFQARHLLQGTPGLVEDTVVAAQVTGVMIGNLLPVLFGDLQFPVVEKLEEVLKP